MPTRSHPDTRGFLPKANFPFSKWILYLGSVLKAILTGRIFAAMHPRMTQAETVYANESAPVLKPGQRIKIMSWNVQFMAGKNYVFFFDVQDARGKDERPSPRDIKKTLRAVASVIRDEDPDIMMLQEVDCGADRTDRMDQLAELRKLLPSDYCCYTQTSYWKAGFVPHPRVRGSAGLTLVILSKYQIRDAKRFQLAIMPADPITQHFSMKRALLEARFPVRGGRDFVVLTTHLSAFAQGYDTLARQVRFLKRSIERLNQAKTPWVMGGDFNLLPNSKARKKLLKDQQVLYNPKTEIADLLVVCRSVPSSKNMRGPNATDWYTHHPNHPDIKQADRTIDYLFFPKKLTIEQTHVRRKDTAHLSDHYPVIATITLPK